MNPSPVGVAHTIERHDWSRATRGRLAKRIAAEGSNLRALDPDLAAAFPDSESVNAGLRAVLAIRDVWPAPRRRSKPRRAA